MHWKKSKYKKKKQRAITQKLSKIKQNCLVLEICTGKNLSIKKTKDNNSKKKARKSYGSYALYSPLIRSIHPQNFITIASIVLEICTGQNSSMKINKGQ